MTDTEHSGEVMDVIAGVRQLPAKGDFPPMRVDHYILRIGGGDYAVTSYRPQDERVPYVGDTLSGELAGPDKWDKERLKFTVRSHVPVGGEWLGPAPAPAGAPPMPPPNAAPTPAAPAQSAPAIAASGERTERLAAMQIAIDFIAAKCSLGLLADFNLADLEQLADELQHKARQPFKPMETMPAPDAADLPPSGGAMLNAIRAGSVLR